MSKPWNGFGSIDLSDVEADAGKNKLRPGAYICRISDAEVKETKDQKGRMVYVKYTAIEGGSGDVEEYINVHNPSEQAQDIGLRRLKALLIACGHPNPNRPGDINTLKGKTVGVRVERDADWVNSNGEAMVGGPKVRRSGPYFEAVGHTEVLGAIPEPVRVPSAGGSNQQRAGMLNDAIPF